MRIISIYKSCISYYFIIFLSSMFFSLANIIDAVYHALQFFS